MMRKLNFLICLLVFGASCLFGEIGSAELGTSEYEIFGVDFSIDGRTQEFVLSQKAEISIGRRFSSLAELEAFLADRRQVLLNERVLESVEIGYSLDQEADNSSRVFVHVLAKDTWNIIALPYFRYDSNTGLLLSVRGRDYNFLGSMQTLVLNFDYAHDELGRNGLGGYANFAIPFQANDFIAMLGFSEDLRIFAGDTPVKNVTSASGSVRYDGFGFPITAKLSQSYSTNPSGVEVDSDPYFLTTSIGLEARIVVLEELGSHGSLFFEPSITLSRMWRFEAPVRLDRQGNIFTLANALSWGRANWVGNMKSGLAATLSNTNYLYLRDGSWIIDFDATLGLFATHRGLISIQSLFSAFYRPIGAPRTDVGDPLRGILDRRVDGNSAFYLNLDLPIKLFDFPTHAIIGKNWFDFELQASPFIDAAITWPSEGGMIGGDNAWLSGGLELLVYPLRMRSFIIRASAGFDFKNILATGSLTEPAPDGAAPYEIFFGLGLHY